ncbi:hypothetical protein VTK73DRAFT_1241 [Phialemonium thermophilum]|uniref:Uncharacterized protein n=1 Tax=Phialemonium thermophilum TaxID=223376 RepID=A0ABR3Y347_9PEZI
MPGLAIATDAPFGRQSLNVSRSRQDDNSRSPSPVRPPMSPLSPNLSPTQNPPLTSGPAPASRPPTLQTGITNPATLTSQPLGDVYPDFSRGRPVLSHPTQPDQAVNVIPPPEPRPEPLNLDDNPDALALRSAISILQLQRAKAERDIQTLARAKADALADPAAFVSDLCAGRVSTEGDLLFPDGKRPLPQQVRRNVVGNEGTYGSTKHEEEEEDEDDDDLEPEHGSEEDSVGASATNKSGAGAVPETGGEGQETHEALRSAPKPPISKPAWQTLPKPQNVVRCPPINWAQYAVVGESLDKLHEVQKRVPTEGLPTVVVGTGGATQGPQAQPITTPATVVGGQRKLVGIAAPYSPMRDRLENKTKGGKK